MRQLLFALTPLLCYYVVKWEATSLSWAGTMAFPLFHCPVLRRLSLRTYYWRRPLGLAGTTSEQPYNLISGK
jgi:hypothetical protein